MAYAEAPLNGSADIRVSIYTNLVSQNAAGNYSTFYYAFALLNPTLSPTWSGGAQYWSANLGYGLFGGAFTLDLRGIDTFYLATGYVNQYHNLEGYGSDWYGAVSVDTDHSAVGDGSVGVVTAAAGRIAKRPSPPVALGLDRITPNSMRFRFNDGPNNGAPITSRGVQRATQPNFSDAVLVDGGGGTITLGGLPPGTRQYVRVRTQNSQGVSDWSNVVSDVTLSASKISDDDAFIDADPLISKGGLWVPARADISKAGAWTPAG